MGINGTELGMNGFLSSVSPGNKVGMGMKGTGSNCNKMIPIKISKIMKIHLTILKFVNKAYSIGTVTPNNKK